MRNMLMKVLVGTGLALSLGPAFADAMCGPNGEFNPMDNQCWPIQNQGGGGGGGGGTVYLPPDPKWGAIAIDVAPTGKKSGYGSSTSNQTEANKKAIGYCGTNTCKVVATFKNSCGAVASGDNGMWAVGIDTNKKRALQKAADACYAKGAKVCREWVAPSCANSPKS